MTLAPLTPSSISAVTFSSAPVLAANPFAKSTTSCVGCNSSGATMRMLTPNIAPVTNNEFAMLLRPSPTKANVKPRKWPKFSLIVIKSAIICVGCHWSVKPFQTGTPEYLANPSTSDCLKPRNSMASNIRPRTIAVSSTDSFLPNWMSFEPRYSG